MRRQPHYDQKYQVPHVTLLAGSARLAPGFRWNLVMQYWAKVLCRPASVRAQTWQGVKKMEIGKKHVNAR